MFTPNLVEKQLRTIVAQSLQIPEKNVHFHSTLMLDLEAESIDILDMRFAIEQKFGFKFDQTAIKKLLTELLAEHQLTANDIPKLFTVKVLYDYILFRLGIETA